MRSNEIVMKTFALFVLALVNSDDASEECRKLTAAATSPTAVLVLGSAGYEKSLIRIN